MGTFLWISLGSCVGLITTNHCRSSLKLMHISAWKYQSYYYTMLYSYSYNAWVFRFFHHFFLSNIGKGCCTPSTPQPDSFKDNGSGSLDRVEVRSLLKQLNKAVGEKTVEVLRPFRGVRRFGRVDVNFTGTFCTGGAEYFAKWSW